jgi:hypothetical protein
MDNSQSLSRSSSQDRVELLKSSPWLFFLYWPGITYRLGDGPQRRAMGCLGICDELRKLFEGQESTESLVHRFDARCRRLIFVITVPVGLLLNLVVFACAVPALMAHGILPTNDYLISLLDRYTDVTAVATVVALISLGYLALLCRDIYHSFTNLFDVYNMALDESETVRQEVPLPAQKELRLPQRNVAEHSPAAAVESP